MINGTEKSAWVKENNLDAQLTYKNTNRVSLIQSITIRESSPSEFEIIVSAQDMKTGFEELFPLRDKVIQLMKYRNQFLNNLLSYDNNRQFLYSNELENIERQIEEAENNVRI